MGTVSFMMLLPWRLVNCCVSFHCLSLISTRTALRSDDAAGTALVPNRVKGQKWPVRDGGGFLLVCPIMSWITPSSLWQLCDCYPPFCGGKPQMCGSGTRWREEFSGRLTHPECWHWRYFHTYTRSANSGLCATEQRGINMVQTLEMNVRLKKKEKRKEKWKKMKEKPCCFSWFWL